MDTLSKRNDDYLEAVKKLYGAMVTLDLNKGEAFVFRSEYDLDLVDKCLQWEELMHLFIERHIFIEDKEKTYSLFSTDNLLLLCDSDAGEKSIEVRFLNEDGKGYSWVEILATISNRKEHQILITVKTINEKGLQNRVLDYFLYHQNCDFLILVDTKEGSYKMFNVRPGSLPVPEMGYVDYTNDMINFNKKFVVKSEVDKVILQMSLENLEKNLLDCDEYSFSCGIIIDSGEYKRAKMQQISFDREQHLVIVARTDITEIYMEEKRRNEQLLEALHAAERDLLTGLYNQTTTERIVSQMLESYQGELAAVLFIDVDNFKLVNDRLGHLKGNELLEKLAVYLMEISAKESIVGRVGGDEFLMYIPKSQGIQEIYAIGQKICNAFEGFKDLLGDIPVSCSVGIALYPQDGLTYNILVQKADQALYCAKRYGKNHYFFYSHEMGEQSYSSALSQIDMQK